MAETGRRRRSPDEARLELLTAAAALIARRGPDGVGLRQVAEAVGVSHGLVTHYFGTYSALVRQVLQRESELLVARVRERVSAAGIPLAADMMPVLFDALADERYVRLFAWAELHPDVPGPSSRNLRDLVDAMEAGFAAVLPPAERPARDRIEIVVLLGLSAAYGYALGRRSWLTGLGHDPADPAHQAAFRTTLTRVLAAHMTDPSGRARPDRGTAAS
jgi:AcrR family transcriptional regulator